MLRPTGFLIMNWGLPNRIWYQRQPPPYDQGLPVLRQYSSEFYKGMAKTIDTVSLRRDRATFVQRSTRQTAWPMVNRPRQMVYPRPSPLLTAGSCSNRPLGNRFLHG